MLYDVGPIRPPSEAMSLLVRVARNCPWNRCEFCMLYKDAKFQRKSVAEVKADIDRAEAFYGSNRTLVKTAFLQDADPLTVRTAEVVEMLRYIRERFPNVERITAYARGRTIARKSLDDLKRLREAGLSRLHIGLETGYGPLLTALKKGATPEQMIEAGRKAKEADLCVSEYVMPGLGGRGLWREPAEYRVDPC